MKWNDLELLKDPAVRAEIERYKWFESEKEGRDIGWERASEEWIGQYSDVWRKAHPVRKRSARKTSG